MKQLWLFLKKHHLFLLFLFLESLAFFWLFNLNVSYRAIWLSSASALTGHIYEMRQKVGDYFQLKKENNMLTVENSKLKQTLLTTNTAPCPGSEVPLLNSVLVNDSFSVVPARVLTNTLHLAENYLTIDKGHADGITENTSIISNAGVVGRVTQLNTHYSLVMPVIHIHSRTNVQHKPSEYNGNLVWNGRRTTRVTVTNIPRHITINTGDTIVTSAYSKVFPYGIPVGVVSHISADDTGNFYLLDVDLATDFHKLNHVYALLRDDIETVLMLEKKADE